MDFDRAAQRLQRESKQRQGRKPVRLSAKATHEAELHKAAASKRAHERKQIEQQKEIAQRAFRQCERTLAVKHLGPPNTSDERLLLRPTSIHGGGDKITLPPSVLERLSNSSVEHPWMFRLGIPNPDYIFPSSPLLRQWSAQLQRLEGEDAAMDDHDDDGKLDMDDMDNDDFHVKAYLDELRHKYLAFTHGAVVEFTQDDGFVGLPASIASFLIKHSEGDKTFRTRDPSGTAAGDSEMDVDRTSGSGDDDEKTPGHLAWGAFDLPDSVIEISLIQLPKGKAARLMPSKEAIVAGFYGLKDIKLVLEQSLIRTRATLTVNDHVATWHRGKRFDLAVTSLNPESYVGVSCINTDIEIDFEAPPEDLALPMHRETETTLPAEESTVGRTLRDATAGQTGLTWNDNTTAPPLLSSLKLPCEPPDDAPKEDVAHIQMRNPDGKTLLRRFWKSRATIQDLFDVAQTIEPPGSFQLVTRFPRRVWTIDQAARSFESEKIGPGKEVLLIERL